VFGAWFQSKEISSLPGRGKEKRTQYRLFTKLTRKISRQLTIAARLSFFNQDRNQTVGVDSIGNVYSGFVSLRYTFDPVIF
jgi:hypothetical protein